MKKITALILVFVCVFSLVACSGSPVIISIRDRVEEEGFSTLTSLEFFYEDENTKYYFPVIKSQFIIVTYLNGDSEDIVTALEAGRATIADLDRFGIKYCTEPKKE